MSGNDDNGFIATVFIKVLELETNDARFETLSRATVSSIEGGAQILSTSASWDLGRDGVGVGSAKGIYICASLRDDVDIKSLTDIQRICSTTDGIQRVYFCSSQSLSEHRRTSIEQQLNREIDGQFPITCFGALQIAEIAAKIPNLIRRHYGPEINDVLRVVKSDPNDEEEIVGLRLALISAAADNSQEIRNQVYRVSLLNVFSDGRRRTVDSCANHLSASLKVARSLPSDAIKPHLDNLLQLKLLSFDGTTYVTTEEGISHAKALEVEGAGRLLAGRHALRKSLESAIATPLADDHFAKIWTVLEERMTHYFSSRGFSIVAEISAIMNEDGNTVAAGGYATSPLSFLDELAKAIAGTSSHAQQAAELAQAAKDLFTDRSSVATDWLVRLAATFLTVCALGLEHSSGRALSKLLSRTTLVLDSDVVLSLLGVGEPEHDAVETIVTRWNRNNGKVLVGEPVLEEVAYHAFIAQNDFNQVRGFLPGTREDRLHIVDNVFVRSFGELMSQKKAQISQWHAFISQFRGKNKRDWQNVFNTMSAEYFVEKLPPRSTAEADLEVDVADFLVVKAEERAPNGATYNARDKARRDAQLYAALVSHVKALKRADPGATCLMVSSARRLANAESQFHESGEPQLVVSISSVLYLVSMMPAVSLGLSAMRAFLFDERRRGLSSDLERTLLRMVRSSEEVSMPFAKRGLLMRSVRDRMITDARSKGIRHIDREAIETLEREALNKENEGRTIEILRASLDEIAVDRRVEKENAALKARVRELELEVERGKSRNRKR